MFIIIHSVTREQHLYATNPLASGMHSHPIKHVASNKDVEMTAATTRNAGTLIANQGATADGGVVYDVIDPRLRKINADGINMKRNPAYVETKLT